MRNCVLCNSFDPIDERKILQIKDDRSQVTDPGSAYQMVSMLRGAVIRGTGRLVIKLIKLWVVKLVLQIIIQMRGL